jgi:ribosomal protein L11 methyltransferase
MGWLIFKFKLSTFLEIIMTWTEISIGVSFEDSEAVSYILQCQTGDAGLVEEHKENKIIYKIYFQEDEYFEDHFDKLKKTLQDYSIDLKDISCVSLGEENWSESWKKFFEPLKIGKNIVIKPPWKEYIPQEGEKVIVINPGMAFGIGSHETTRMASYYIQKYAPYMDSLLDLGCGTGILAIIACICCVKNVYAIDNDELAGSALKENLTLNNLEERVKFFHHEGLKNFPYKVEIIVANIQASVFKEIKKDFYPLLISPGILILTGILAEQKDDILSIFYEEKFELLEELKEAEWVCLVLKKYFESVRT